MDPWTYSMLIWQWLMSKYISFIYECNTSFYEEKVCSQSKFDNVLLRQSKKLNEKTIFKITKRKLFFSIIQMLPD